MLWFCGFIKKKSNKSFEFTRLIGLISNVFLKNQKTIYLNILTKKQEKHEQQRILWILSIWFSYVNISRNKYFLRLRVFNTFLWVLNFFLETSLCHFIYFSSNSELNNSYLPLKKWKEEDSVPRWSCPMLVFRTSDT
jgi:type I restriction-modification system DNA methylase subunit